MAGGTQYAVLGLRRHRPGYRIPNDGCLLGDNALSLHRSPRCGTLTYLPGGTPPIVRHKGAAGTQGDVQEVVGCPSNAGTL